MEGVVFKIVLTAVIVVLCDTVIINNFEFDDLGFIVSTIVLCSFFASLAIAVFGYIYLIWA